MKIPGPDHPISICATAGRIRVLFGGRVIADTTRAPLRSQVAPAI